MKFLKYTLLFLLALLLIGLLYVAMQPSDYNVARSKIIKQPITKVFNTVNDLKTWEKWGPWHDEDSTIVVTYGDKTVGVGASDSWTSKDGPGAMKTVAVEPNKSIQQEMTFGDNEPSEILWDFEKAEGGTKITWTMKDDKAPFFFKIFSALSGGWDGMLGPMIEKGLDNLNGVITSTPDPYSIGKIKIVENEEKSFIGFPFKMKIDMDAMQKTFEETMPKVGAYAAQSGLGEGDFVPGALYYKWDEKNNEAEFHIGLFLTKDIKAGEGMDKVKVVGGKYVSVTKCGAYGVGDYEAHTKIGNYIAENKLSTKYPLYEMYVNDPAKVKEQDIQTDIYYLVE